MVLQQAVAELCLRPAADLKHWEEIIGQRKGCAERASACVLIDFTESSLLSSSGSRKGALCLFQRQGWDLGRKKTEVEKLCNLTVATE